MSDRGSGSLHQSPRAGHDPGRGSQPFVSLVLAAPTLAVAFPQHPDQHRPEGPASSQSIRNSAKAQLSSTRLDEVGAVARSHRGILGAARDLQSRRWPLCSSQSRKGE
jgi:hypothetical protein